MYFNTVIFDKHIKYLNSYIHNWFFYSYTPTPSFLAISIGKISFQFFSSYFSHFYSLFTTNVSSILNINWFFTLALIVMLIIIMRSALIEYRKGRENINYIRLYNKNHSNTLGNLLAIFINIKYLNATASPLFPINHLFIVH